MADAGATEREDFSGPQDSERERAAGPGDGVRGDQASDQPAPLAAESGDRGGADNDGGGRAGPLQQQRAVDLPAGNPASANKPAEPLGYDPWGGYTPKVKKKRGRPKGSRNKVKWIPKPPPPRKPNSDRLAVKKNEDGTIAKVGFATNINLTYARQWREVMRIAKEQSLNVEDVRGLYEDAKAIARDPKRGSDQVRMVEFLLEHAWGKASSKIEVDTTSNTQLTISEKIELAKIAAGLLQAQTVTVKTLPEPEVVEGEIVDATKPDGLPESA